MRQFYHFLSLPTSLLVLLAAWQYQPSTAQEWPYKHPAQSKQQPEHQALIPRRDVEIHQRLSSQTPVGVQKMSEDPGEMFFLDYWQFEVGESREEPPVVYHSSLKSTQHRQPGERFNLNAHHNLSLPLEILPPFLLHSSVQSPNLLSLRHYHPALLFKRDFQCPGGTSSCSSVNRPNSCCATGETCVIVTDVGLGDVGCCPQGQTCGGSVQGCNVLAGYISCPGSSNGGCCIPNYSCKDVGCVAESTTTLVTTLSLARITAAPSVVVVTTTISVPTSSSPSPVISTTIITATFATTTADGSGGIVIVTVQATPAQSVLTCPSSYQTCPSSFGGGCCPSSLVCGTSGSCMPSSTITITTTELLTNTVFVAPQRPTSDSASLATTTVRTDVPVGGGVGATGDPLTSTTTVCPTGFYACSAYYPGAGCCRVGRDCQSTSCPAASSTSLVSDSVATVIAPTGVAVGISTTTTTLLAVTTVVTDTNSNAVVAAGAPTTITTTVDPATITTTAMATAAVAGTVQQGACANGWFACGAAQGSGCCPVGYACGASCTNTGNSAGPGSVGKIAPASLAVRAEGWGKWMVGFGVVVGVGMVGL